MRALALYAVQLQEYVAHAFVAEQRTDGVDGSTMEANGAMRSTCTDREMATRIPKESGVETPTIGDLIRPDRNARARSSRKK